MASDRPIFLRPIEITSSNDGININVGGAGANTRNITNGVYGSISSLLYEIMNTTLAADNIVCYLTADWKVVWYHSSATSFVVDWDAADANNQLRDIMGWSVDLSGASTYTSTYTASNLWYPTYARSNRDHWTLDQKKAVDGINAQNGRFAGFGFGPQIHENEIDFMHEPALNVADEFATNTYYENRNFETFLYETRAATPTVSTSPPVKGFYYIPDNTTLTGGTDGSKLLSSMDSGGINYNYSSSPDTYTFCSLTRRVVSEKVSLPNTRTRYNVSLAMLTSTAPTWNGEL